MANWINFQFVQNLHILPRTVKPINPNFITWDGSKTLADNAMVALTLLIAESRSDEKDNIVKVIVNLINRNND
jgi:hypothetical protein